MTKYKTERLQHCTADCNLITLTERLLLWPAQIVAGQQEAEWKTPSSRPSNPTVTAPDTLQGAYVQTAVPHHGHRQNTASCTHMDIHRQPYWLKHLWLKLKVGRVKRELRRRINHILRWFTLKWINYVRNRPTTKKAISFTRYISVCLMQDLFFK